MSQCLATSTMASTEHANPFVIRVKVKCTEWVNAKD